MTRTRVLLLLAGLNTLRANPLMAVNTTAPSTLLQDNGDGGNIDLLRNVVVGSTIGVSSIMVLTLLVVCGVLYCYQNKERVSNLDDTIEYTTQEEYEAKINFDTLEKLDPAIRARIDMDFLAKLTNTDPAKLSKYQVSIDEERTPASACQSPSATSMTSIHQIGLESIQLCQKILPALNASLNNNNNSSSTDLEGTTTGIRRVTTISDFGSSLNSSLGSSGFARTTSLRRGSFNQNRLINDHEREKRGSANSVTEPGKGNTTQDLLRILSMVPVMTASAIAIDKTNEDTNTN